MSLSPDFWRRQRVLVTGGGGFLGGHVVDAVKKLGPQALAAPRRAQYDLARLERVESLMKEHRPSLIINLAAVCGGIGANQAEPGRFFYDNIIMGAQLMDAARRFKVGKYVQIGTVCSYPKLGPVPFQEERFWDGYPEETNAPYGIAKKALLTQSQAYRKQYGFNAVYLIPINLYGPRDHFDPETSHVIPALIRKCLAAVERGERSIECWGSGNATREFLYVDDAVKGILLAAELYDKPEPVNLGCEGEIAIKDLVGVVARLTGFDGEIKWDGSRPDGQPRRALDSSRARREFGFKAEVGLEEGLRRTIAWYRRQETSFPPARS